MAYDPATGVWTPEDEGVSTRLNGMLSSESPYMKAAETRGLKSANRRGLINSSMGVQAGQAAAIDAALPIASQEASQVHSGNLNAAQRSSTESVASMNVGANDRQYTSAATAQATQTYNTMYNSIMANTRLSAADREAQLVHAAAIRDSDMALIEQIYGVNLDWAGIGGTAPGAEGAPALAGTPVPGNGVAATSVAPIAPAAPPVTGGPNGVLASMGTGAGRDGAAGKGRGGGKGLGGGVDRDRARQR